MATRKLGKYQLFERLGRGGMAEVYRAHHLSLDRFVAIKVLHAFLADDPEFKDRFEKEARNIARLKHPHIVQVYDFENDPDQENYYMVMELVDGPTLKDVLADETDRGEVMPLDEAIRIIREAAGALAYAHSQRMIHRDVKPANLMLDHDNRVILTDFGIAKIVSGAHFTSSGGMVGTPAYMSPEQGAGEAGDERSDLYSLGVIFFQMVTGRLPYDAETPLAIILKHLNEAVPSAQAINPEVPEAIDYIIQRLMAKDPRVRYQTANELIADLGRFEQGAPLAESSVSLRVHDTGRIVTSTQPLPQVAARGAPPRRRIPLWLWILIGGIIGAVAFSLVQSGGSGLLAFLASPTPTMTATATTTPTSIPTLTPTDQPTLTAVPSNTAAPPPTNTLQPSSTATLTPTATFTLTPTETPTLTLMPSDTLTPSQTLPPTDTLTPSITPTASLTQVPTLDITLTLIQATLLANFQTATINACDYNYEIVDQTPADGSSVAANQDYDRQITLKNTGSCPWERNSALMFVSGDNFGAGARIILRDRVNVGDEAVLDFKGRTPAGHDLLSGTWELRTPGNIRIGQSLIISINVFGG